MTFRLALLIALSALLHLLPVAAILMAAVCTQASDQVFAFVVLALSVAGLWKLHRWNGSFDKPSL